MSESSSLGIALGVFAYGLFSAHDAAIKWLVDTLPVWQVLFFRSVAVLTAVLAIGNRPLIERAVTSPLRWALTGRAVLMLIAWICYFTAARTIPLAQLISLYFAAPLVVTLLAAPLLGEHVTIWRWAAVLVGFFGVMLASDPWGVSASVATLLVLIAAAIWGYGIILMRMIARRETSMMQMLFTNSVFLVGTGIACLFTWQPTSAGQLLLLLGIGVSGGLAQYCVFEAARHAPASVMATVEYSGLIWAFILGFAIWGDIPTPAVWAGAGLICLAGVLLVFSERRRPPSAF